MIVSKIDGNSADITAELLREKKIVIIPTDTIYGFSGIMPETADKIAAIKGRNASKQFIALIAKPEDYKKYTDISIPQKFLSLWPGPLTLIMRLKNGNTQAFRCPNDNWLREVVEKTGKPIYSTSANRSGFPPLTDIEEIKQEFQQDVSLIVDAGKITGLASTIVDISGSEPKLLRQGAIVL
ncbi:Sua5/YciO/YrdC/YwlC family protein [Treponema phagedenis]|uniref:L-threonylcarbamoyladenylate synthase n=1 Tax=Treponema phagedenis TaxID=162 RepID=A0A0B7GQ16_TREPH|nr:L-threonylcarbamoyladenylate synthase [Treponema phagedenis]EFW36555.1 putative Sua5/YciO/YrdC/YwlC family protein [Treponema phagedenis F0421]NVP23331.1 L-threonylcarbamoyladenylate synthase [Treponema phagedenis]QEJ95546.1 L-threonylcarbamoyladenylate synthase [Treponema phagedenis]QEJ98438.1 L-threonylcarbamoyladenylate synthase [Treponema phagedenis]QEK01399.1 L-threonylcarbamoyladenylate synthase [Treponema phagedenis]